MSVGNNSTPTPPALPIFMPVVAFQNSFYTTTFHPQQTPTNAEMFAAAAVAAVANASSATSTSNDPFQVEQKTLTIFQVLDYEFFMRLLRALHI